MQNQSTAEVSHRPTVPDRARASVWPWLILPIYSFVAALYFLIRAGGYWSESDSSAFSTYIRDFVASGRLVPPEGTVYPNGYSFQAISSYIIALSGVDVTTLQQYIYPLTIPLIVLPAWILYRELLNSARGATFATILLFSQPEFLFVVLRSSHEKFTRTLILLCLYCLVRGFKLSHRLWPLATHVALFYLAAYALITSNNLLANSFFFAVAIALGLGWVIGRLGKTYQLQGTQITQRLTYVTLISLGLVFLFTFYAYRPAQHDLLVMQNIGQRIAALFLDVQQRQTANAYQSVVAGWVNLPVYFLMSLANWLVLGISAILWLRQSWKWFRREAAPHSPVTSLLWLLYAAFALQSVISIVSDASGALGSNLQYRVFPSFSIVAVALVGSALAKWQPPRYSRQIGLALSAGVACLALLSVLKATNEPLVSNKWLFYRPQELVALDWTDTHLRNSEIWTEFDERLFTAYRMTRGLSANDNQIRGGELVDSTRTAMISTVTTAHAARLQRPLPLPPDALQVYDNGIAGLYRFRPVTRFQR